MYTNTPYFPNHQAQATYASYILQTVTGLELNTAAALLQQVGSLQKLAQMSEVALCKLPGIGKRRAAQIVAMTEWALLLQRVPSADRLTIRCPGDIANLLMLEMSLLEREELRVVVLNTKQQVQTVDILYKGSVNHASIRVAEVFRPAILHNAPSLILAHNHPSGDPTPSPEDVNVTRLIYDAGQSLGIDVYDHLIFGQNRFVSLKERGLGFC